jgi:hypothetical protein
MQQFLDDVELLSEDAGTVRRLVALLSDESTAGKQVHDANVVAVALVHHAGAIITDNTRATSRASLPSSPSRTWAPGGGRRCLSRVVSCGGFQDHPDVANQPDNCHGQVMTGVWGTTTSPPPRLTHDSNPV